MNRKNFILIIFLLVISLVSILFVQFNWISDLNRLNEDRFRKDIQQVLFMINERLEEKEIINLTKDNLQATFKIKRSTESGDIELIESTFNKKTLDSSSVLNSDNSLQFNIESGGSKNEEINSNVNASIQIENLQSLNLDSSMQESIPASSNKFEASVELYYKDLKNQIDYIDGADLLINKYFEGDLLSGIGRAYGIELLLKKNRGKFNGWISYTAGRSELKRSC